MFSGQLTTPDRFSYHTGTPGFFPGLPEAQSTPVLVCGAGGSEFASRERIFNKRRLYFTRILRKLPALGQYGLRQSIIHAKGFAVIRTNLKFGNRDFSV